MSVVARTLSRLLPCLLLPPLAGAQAPQTPARVLTVSATSPSAVAEFQSGADAYYLWNLPGAAAHMVKALDMDASFGLGRAYLARTRGGPTMRAELDRAAAEATHGSAAEALLVLAIRENSAGRGAQARAIIDAAATLAPDDPRIALEQALFRPGGPERGDYLRKVTVRFPDFVPARTYLTINLSPNSFDPLPQADGEEALRSAQAALALAPREPGTHTAMGWALIRLGRYDEALTHLTHATTMAEPNEFAFELKADVAIHTGKPALARAELDSAYARSIHLGNRANYRRNRAVMYLHEGRLREMLAALDSLTREHENAGLNDQAAVDHQWMAFAAQLQRDTSVAERHLAEAARLSTNPGGNADAAVIAYFLGGQGAKARASLDRYLAATSNAPRTPGLTQAIHRLTGLTLVAEGNARDAIGELQQGGANPWSQVGLIEAYRRTGDRKAYEAEKAAFLARKTWPYQSTAYPIGKFRFGAR